MRILVTRPIEDGAEIARRLAVMGHKALLAPLLTVRPYPGPPLHLDGIQAILATSANGVRALAARARTRKVPVFAVGPQTAVAAAQVGFVRIRNAAGNAAALADAVCRWADPGAGPLLRVTGEEADGRLAEALTGRGFAVKREVLYRVEAATEMPAAAADALAQGTVQAALFFSPRSARVFVDRVIGAGVSTAGLVAVCISAATADALSPLTFAEIRIADAPNQAALLACL